MLEPYFVEVAIGPLRGSAQGVARDRRAGSDRVGVELAHMALTHHLHRYLDTRRCRRLFIRILYNAGYRTRFWSGVDMSDEHPELDKLQAAYKDTVEAWIRAIRKEEALASVNHDVAEIDQWEQAHLEEDELRNKVKAEGRIRRRPSLQILRILTSQDVQGAGPNASAALSNQSFTCQRDQRGGKPLLGRATQGEFDGRGRSSSSWVV